jgi:hypothetical protein
MEKANQGKVRSIGRMYSIFFLIMLVGFCVISFKYIELKRTIDDKDDELTDKKANLALNEKQLANEARICKEDKDALTARIEECNKKVSDQAVSSDPTWFDRTVL